MVRAALALLLVLSAALGAPEAHAQNRGAAFVADMDTGQVLHARQADAARYPASLTKMMTLYMLFEALERGDVSLGDTMTASAEAASRPASDLGLAAGDTLSVEQAVRALVIRSANDVAVVVAEHLSGTESAFAEAMTTRARALGLTATTFRNASGLHDPAQVTTARDMARLAHALHRDFPQHFHYFAEERFSYGTRTWRNHNSLVGRVEGVDGLKTGYISASGFNVVTTAQRADHRLVTVVMGGRTAAVRDAHAEELIEAAYTAIEAREEGRLLASLETPRLNPVRERELMTAELAGIAGPVAVGSSDGAPAVSVVMDEAGPRDEPRLATAPSWAVQVGAYTSEAAARARLESLTVSAATLTAELSRAAPVTEPVERAGRTLWRARFDGIDADQARRVCEQLARMGEACFAVSPRA